MSRRRKDRIPILTGAILFIAVLFAEVMTLSFTEASAAKPESGAFHLKRYEEVGDQKEATGQEENIEDPSHKLYRKKVVPGVEYEIYQTHEYYEEDLYKIEHRAILDHGENYKTDANGEIHITNLPLGRYTFREVSAPEGILVNPEEYYFTLPYSLEEGGELQYEVYVYPKNVMLTGSLSFQKVGDNGTDGLKNVTFGVYYEEGQPVKDAEGKNLSITTRLNGSATIEELPIGKYYLVETKNPDTDYVVSSKKKYWFEIYRDKEEASARAFYTDETMSKKITDAEGKALAEGIIINYKAPEVKKTASAKQEQDIKDGLVYVDTDGSLYANVDIPYVYTITTTLPKNLKEYTKFEIYDAFDSGNIVLVTALSELFPVAFGGSSQPKLVSGKDYKVVKEGMAGYRMKFTEAGIAALAAAKCTEVKVTFDAKIPKGYQVDGTVKQGEHNEAVVEFTTGHSDPSVSNTRNTVYPRAGEIIVHKVDGKDQTKRLKGAEFSLKDASGKEYSGSEYVSYLDLDGRTTTDKKKAATFIFSQLPYGTYTLRETHAPSGYQLSKKTETIELRPKEEETATWQSREVYYKNDRAKTGDKKEPMETNDGKNPTRGKLTSVKTGDETNVLPYIISLLCCGMAAAVLYKRKKTGSA